MTRSPNASESLDLDVFARVMAHLRRFPADRKAEVLGRLGLDAPTWETAVATWAAARDAELARGATDLTRRFGVAFGRALKRLEKEDPRLDALRPLGDAPGVPAPDPPPPVAPSIPAPPPAVVAPSVIPSPPWVAPPPIVAPPAFIPPAVVAAPKRPAATLHLAAAAPERLPFAPGAPAGAGLAAALAHARAVQGPVPAVIGFGETVALSGGLPLGETVALPDSGAGVEGPRAPPGVPELTLPQYASLRVELQTAPDQAEAILGRYGVGPGGRPALDAHWRARFQADPLSRMMFARAYATYVAWLREQRGGG